jgi:hypothetical protein
VNTFIKGIAIGYFIMGWAFLSQPFTIILIQYMVGLIMLTLGLLIWKLR